MIFAINQITYSYENNEYDCDVSRVKLSSKILAESVTNDESQMISMLEKLSSDYIINSDGQKHSEIMDITNLIKSGKSLDDIAKDDTIFRKDAKYMVKNIDNKLINIYEKKVVSGWLSTGRYMINESLFNVISIPNAKIIPTYIHIDHIDNNRSELENAKKEYIKSNMNNINQFTYLDQMASLCENVNGEFLLPSTIISKAKYIKGTTKLNK